MERKEIIQKLKALSERGIAGEKENATKLLEKLMKKYGISEEELQNEKMQIVYVELRTNAEKRICSQILYAYFGNAKLYRRSGTRITFWTELTKAQEIEFKYMLSVYLESFYKEEDIFVSAFIHKNRIFPAVSESNNDKEPPTAEEIAKGIKIRTMMDGIEKAQVRKALKSS